jgi:hypothetical protein
MRSQRNQWEPTLLLLFSLENEKLKQKSNVYRDKRLTKMQLIVNWVICVGNDLAMVLVVSGLCPTVFHAETQPAVVRRNENKIHIGRNDEV